MGRNSQSSRRARSRSCLDLIESRVVVSRGGGAVENLLRTTRDHDGPRTFYIGRRALLKALQELARKLAALGGR